MPQPSDTEGGIIKLPADYQYGPEGRPERAFERARYDVEPELAALDPDRYDPILDVEDMPEATIEEWLVEAKPPEEWVALRTLRRKVLLRGLSEAERKDITKAAPRKMNRATRKAEPDQDWINMELVKRCLLKPQVPNQDMLLQAMAGDLAHLAEEIGRISGFEVGDALE